MCPTVHSLLGIVPVCAKALLVSKSKAKKAAEEEEKAEGNLVANIRGLRPRRQLGSNAKIRQKFVPDGSLRVSRSRNKIVMPKLLPKNEQKHLFFYIVLLLQYFNEKVTQGINHFNNLIGHRKNYVEQILPLMELIWYF